MLWWLGSKGEREGDGGEHCKWPAFEVGFFVRLDAVGHIGQR